MNSFIYFKMGQTLSEPITHKETSKCENEFLKVGASCMQGWRISKICLTVKIEIKLKS